MSSSPRSEQSTTGATGSSSSSSSDQTGASGSSASQTPSTSTPDSTAGQSTAGQSTTGSAAGSSAAASGDAKTQIESAFQQQPGLSNVQANVSADSIELTGTVETGKDKKEAKKIAKEHANGLKVVDHLKVTGKGEAKQDSTQ
jgi:hypothetical protein